MSEGQNPASGAKSDLASGRSEPVAGAARGSDRQPPDDSMKAEYMSALLDHSPTLAFLKDDEGRYVFLNKAYEDAFVHTSDWYGKTDFDFWPEESAELFRANDAEVLASNEVHRYVEDSSDLAGSRHVWVNYKFPFIDSAGRRYTGGIGVDATSMFEAEEALRESEERKAFLLKLSDVLKPLSEPAEILATVCEMVGRHFAVSRCGYAEVPPPYDHLVVARDWTNGVMESLEGAWPLDSFGKAVIAAYRSGQTVVFDDVFEDNRIRGHEVGLEAAGGVRSGIAAQLMKEGQWVATFYVQDVVARHWTQGEIELMEDLAQRTWSTVERAKAEELLRDSERKYRSLIEQSVDGVFLADAEGNYIDVNPAGATMTGYSADEIRRMAINDLIVEEDRKRLPTHVSRLEAGDVVTSEWCFKRKDGSTFLGEVVSRQLPSGQLLAILRDISERKRIEEALQRSEAAARELIRYAPTGIYEIDFRTKRFTSVNDAMVALSGYCRDELLSMDATQILTPASQRVFAERMAKALAGDTPTDEVEYLVRKKDGTEIAVVLNVRFEPDENGAPTRALVIGHDVTERRRTADLLEYWADMNLMFADLGSLLLSNLRTDEDIPSAFQLVGRTIGANGVAEVIRSEDTWQVYKGWGIHAGMEGTAIPHDRLPDHESVRRTLAPKFIADLAEASDPTFAVQKGFASFAIYPMIVRGEFVGTVDFTFEERREFDEEFKNVLARITFTLTSATENVRLYEAEHNIAETLQETLVVLPFHLPEIEFSRAYESATSEAGRVGGDFVDLFEIRRHAIGIVIGDVSGKGIDAAVITSLVRNTVRAHAADGLSPEQVCEKTSNVLRRFTDVDAYVTMFFGILDTKTGRLRYVAAGHPPAVVLGADGTSDELEVKSPIIGAFDDVQFQESRTFLRPGERLVLYTDGVPEARDPKSQAFFDLDGIHRSMKKHQAEATAHLADCLLGDVREFSKGVLRDDAAVLVVEPTRLKSHEDGHPRLEFDEDTL